MEIFFCDWCSSRVTEGDLAEGHAVRVGAYCFCKACWKTAEVRAAAAKVSAVSGSAQTGAGLPVARPSAPAGETGGPVEERPARRRKTPGRNAAVRRSPHRGVPRHSVNHRTPRPSGKNGARPGTPSPTRPHAAVWPDRNPGHVGARHRRPSERSVGTLAMLALCIILGVGLGLLMMYLFASGSGPGASRRRPVSATGRISACTGPAVGVASGGERTCESRF